MKKIFSFGSSLLVFVLFFSCLTLADANVSVDVETTGDVLSEHNIDAGGDVTLYVNGVDWTQYNPNYIAAHEGSWNNNGIDMEDLEETMGKIEKYRNGEEVELTKREYNILMSLLGITDAEIDFQVSPILDEHYSQILTNIYEIEGLYRTFEKLYPDIYCESRKEVMKKYGLKSVKCGLHSKICYNGNLYSHEGGFDYCIHMDKGHSEDGMDIHLKNIKVYDSDENTLTPVEIVLFNNGEKTMNPVVRVDIKKWETVLGHFDKELEEVEGEKTYVVAWDNSDMEAGEYNIRVTIDLDKKEITKDVDFTILPGGSLAKEGEIVSLELRNEPFTLQETIIETRIKNHGEIPASFKVTGKVYRDGEETDAIESGKVLIKPGETESLQMAYRIPDLGEYEIEIKSNDNMQDMIVFEAVPTTLTGRFMSSPGAAVFSLLLILVIGLYGSRFLYRKMDKKGTIELVKPYRVRKATKTVTKTRAKAKSAGAKRKVTAKKKATRKTVAKKKTVKAKATKTIRKPVKKAKSSKRK